MIFILGFFSSVLGETLISWFEQSFLCIISWVYFLATPFLQATFVEIFPPGLPPSKCFTLLWSIRNSSFSAPESKKKHQQGRGEKPGVWSCMSAVPSTGRIPEQAQGGPGTGHPLVSAVCFRDFPVIKPQADL